MPEITDTATANDTDPALTAIKLPVVTQDSEETETVNECHPDVWDSQGRLISHPFNQ